MKLSYSNYYNCTNQIVLLSFIGLLFAIVTLNIPILANKEKPHIMFIFMGLLAIIGIIYQIYSIIEEDKIRNKEIWKNGEKHKAYIIDIGYIRKIRMGRMHITQKISYSNQNIDHHIVDYYITILYDNSYYADIYSIQYNKAYMMLGMLLNPYPIKEKIEVPIDIYVYKNKVYADLDSVDLAKIQGYEECKKIIEETL